MNLLSKKFKRTAEDFICENCGAEVRGNGYTNHCPKCLFSKHVDVNPGDRKAQCRGLMKPILIDIKHGEKRILYRCQKFGYEKINKVAADDSKEEILKLFNA